MFKLCAFIALVAVASAANPQDAQAETRNYKNEANLGNGAYAYGFETSNGIAQQESGIGGQSAQGSFAWLSPEGAQIQISYVSDANGYRATGNAIPQPPPIPEAILRSLEYIRTHPSAESQPQQFAAPQQQFIPQPAAPQPPQQQFIPQQPQQQFIPQQAPQQFIAPQQQFAQQQQFLPQQQFAQQQQFF